MAKLGPFEILEKLGTVCKACHDGLERTVALNTMDSQDIMCPGW